MRSLIKTAEFVDTCRDGVVSSAEDVARDMVSGRPVNLDALVAAVTEFHLACSDMDDTTDEALGVF